MSDAAPVRLAVIGDPVAHSRSPEFFTAFFAERGLVAQYDRVRVPAGDGAAAIERLRAEGYAGLNVTTPLKEEALRRSETRDEVATAAGSVNLVVLGTKVAGYNTDGAGAIGALAAAGLSRLDGARVLVLGAGPTARASAVALLRGGASVAIWNRSPANAERALASTGASAWSAADAYDAAIATLLPEADVARDAPDVAGTLARTPILIDANYGPRAKLAGNIERPDTHDGSEMLRASARASFEIFLRSLG